MDVERLVVDYLNSLNLGATAYYDVPADRPESFLVVEQTGGGLSNYVVGLPSVDVDCWAPTRREAALLAEAVAHAAIPMPERLEDVFYASVSSTYHNPDLDTRPPTERYTVGIDLTVMDN